MKVAELDTPALLVNVSCMENNIREMTELAAHSGVRMRPHIKTHKTPEIAKRQIQAGATGITVAKLGEAEVMIAAGITNVFVANEIVDNKKIEKLLRLCERAHLSTAVDSLDVAAPLSRAFTGARKTLDILLEIDSGLGRCGIAPGEPALAQAREIAQLPGLKLKGIMTHEGHVGGIQDPAQRKEAILGVQRTMLATADLLRASGLEIEDISIGSTPSIRSCSPIKGITEIRPGTYIFFDLMNIRLESARENDCAATVLSTVISRPAADRAILDAGSKVLTVSKDETRTPPIYGLIRGQPQASLVSLSEEHGFLRVEGAAQQLKVGDRVEVIPYHICPVVNLFDQIAAVCGEDVVDIWPVSARGKSQ